MMSECYLVYVPQIGCIFGGKPNNKVFILKHSTNLDGLIKMFYLVDVVNSSYNLERSLENPLTVSLPGQGRCPPT